MVDVIRDVPLTHSREVEHRRLLAQRVNASAVKFPPGVGLYGGTAQTLTGAGAVDVTSAITHIETTAADALTLADGIEGQFKFLVMTSDGGNGTLTPTNLGNGTTVTFANVDEVATLLFTNDSWYFMSGTAVLA